MNLTGTAARVTYSILAAIIAFIIMIVLGLVIQHFDASIGDVFKRFAFPVAVLVGIGWFLTNRGNPV